MLVNSINESLNSDGSIDVIVKINKKNDLLLNFQGGKSLPYINDCVFLTLYIQSMQDGTDFYFPKESPVSTKLVANLAKHQEIFTQWFKNDLAPINVHVETMTESANVEGSVSLFSGGIDSFYTYVAKKVNLSHVFLCLGLDIQLEETKKIGLALQQYSEFAKNQKKQLLVVSTNIRHVFPNGNRPIQHAALLTALVLAYGLKTLYIPASHNIDELFPWGSHLLSDPLLSNGITEVIHHGAIPRTEKTEEISKSQTAIDSIRICNSSEEFNCGECEKCLRTMFALAVLNKQAKSLPPLEDKISILTGIKIFKDSQYTFWLDNYILAMAHQRLDLAKYANKIIRSYQWRQWIKQGVNLLRNKS